jgi:hypothetical protein
LIPVLHDPARMIKKMRRMYFIVLKIGLQNYE